MEERFLAKLVQTFHRHFTRLFGLGSLCVNHETISNPRVVRAGIEVAVTPRMWAFNELS
jgi:hypothetical protein